MAFLGHYHFEVDLNSTVTNPLPRHKQIVHYHATPIGNSLCGLVHLLGLGGSTGHFHSSPAPVAVPAEGTGGLGSRKGVFLQAKGCCFSCGHAWGVQAA